MSLDNKIIELFINFLVNVASTYFVTAMISTTIVTRNMEIILGNFFINIISATMYFILAIKLKRTCE